MSNAEEGGGHIALCEKCRGGALADILKFYGVSLLSSEFIFIILCYWLKVSVIQPQTWCVLNMPLVLLPRPCLCAYF